MDEILIKILFAIGILVGFFGAFLPVLPGAPLAFASLLIAKLTGFSELSWWVVGIFGVLTLTGILLDYLVPLVATKKMGGSRYGIAGMLIGLAVGIFLAPFGLFSVIVTPFLGAFVGELLYDHQNKERALKSAFGVVVGYFLSSGFGMVLCMTMLVVFVGYDILNIW